MLQFYNNIQTIETKDKNLLTPCPQTPTALSKFTVINLNTECSGECIAFTIILCVFLFCPPSSINWSIKNA